MNSILSGLNERQQEAVVTSDGPCLVVAGPGTGKTKVLTARIAYLLCSQKVKPEEVIVLAFSNKAANDMRSGISKMVKSDLNNLLCGTFYNCFLKMLQEDFSYVGYNSFFSIYEYSDSRDLLEHIIKTRHFDEKVYKVDDIATKISICKNSIITYEDYKKNDKFLQKDKNDGIGHFVEIYSHYCASCKESNAMDFDDILLNAYLLLKNNQQIRNKYQKMFKYIFVDEFQDTSKVQYELVKMLNGNNNSVFVVGDDSQSICSSHGAVMSNIVNFKKDFNGCKVFNFEQSYRSYDKITNIANSVISHDKKTTHKNVLAKQDNKNSNKGQVYIIKTLTPSDEAHSVALCIESVIKEKKIKYSDVAVLYRSDEQAALLENVFNHADIRYKTYRRTSLFQKKIIRSIIGYLRVITNNFDSEGIRLSINEPRRGLGGGVLEKIYTTIENSHISLWEAFTTQNNIFNRKSKDLLSKYVKVIEDGMKIAAKHNAYELVNSLLSDIEILDKLKKGKTEKDKLNYSDIVYFVNIVKSFVDDTNNTDKSIYAFLRNITFNDDYVCDDLSDTVSLMPVHATKGLEFKCVCVFGLNDGLFPLIDNTVDIAEERRLFYVAITRTKDLLVLSFSENIDTNGFLKLASPSRFFKEIDKKYLGKANVKNLEEIKEKNSQLTNDFAKYSIFNYSIISKRSKCKKNVPYISPDLLKYGSYFHYSQYGWGVVTAKMECGNVIIIRADFEEYGVHEVVYDPTKVFMKS
ncbi:MAG: ATP-dependent helicase [Cytophagales bacterium]|nr:ATP-dependent helicase [Cytophagales bacterium]